MFSRRSIVGYAGALLSGLFISKNKADIVEKTQNEKTDKEMIEYLKEVHKTKIFKIINKIKDDRPYFGTVYKDFVHFSHEDRIKLVGEWHRDLCIHGDKDRIIYVFDISDQDVCGITIYSVSYYTEEIWARENGKWIKCVTEKELEENAKKVLEMETIS